MELQTFSVRALASLAACLLACGEPAGAENVVEGALVKKNKKQQTSKPQPIPQLDDSMKKKPIPAPVASLLAQAKKAGWSKAQLQALDTVVTDATSLTKDQSARARCRLGKVFKARKPLLLTTLREAGATKAELDAAAKAVDQHSAALCSGAATKSAEIALGSVIKKVDARLTKGTALAGHSVTLDAFEDLVREMMTRCFEPTDALSLGDLAGLSDKQFDARLDKLAFGRCGQRPGVAGNPGGLPNLPPGSDTDGYAQCVRAAFRDGVRSTQDCQDIAGGDGDGDGDAPESNPAADEHDHTEQSIGATAVAVGAATVIVGAGVVVTAAGVATAEFGVGLAIVALGAAITVYGLERMGDASGRYIERNHQRAPWSLWQCPTMSTPAGSFGFATSGGAGAQPRMTVMDAMRACRCENNPLDAFLSSGAMGAFGGPSCGLGDRLACLREAGNDIAAPPSPECAAMLREDNQVSLAARFQQCSVINCGTNGLLGEDCSCWNGGGGAAPGGGGQDPCATVRCPAGATPVPVGMRCTCESGAPSGGSDCLPGSPGCSELIKPSKLPAGGGVPGAKGLPGGLPGGGGLPLPKNSPLPKPHK